MTLGKHQMTVISADSSGFGMYRPGEYNGDILDENYDWRDALSDTGAEYYTADEEDIPPEALALLQAVKGSCYDEPDILIAVRREEGSEEHWQIEGVKYLNNSEEE